MIGRASHSALLVGRQGFGGVESEVRHGGGDHPVAASEAGRLLVAAGSRLRVHFDDVRVQVYEPDFGDALPRGNPRSHDRLSRKTSDLICHQTFV